MKPTLHLFCALLALSFAIIPVGCSQGPGASLDCSKDYWVAPTGSDGGNDGRESRPFQTIERARQAVRSDPARGQCTIHVNIRGGTYSLASPLQFDPGDSGSDRHEVVYRAAPGNTQPVVISGGIVVEGFDCSTGSCKASVPGWPAGQIARQLYVDDVRAIRARSNYDPAVSVQEANPVYARTDKGYEVPLGGWAPRLEHPEWAEVVTVTQWKMMRCPLTGAPATTLTPDPQCWRNANSYPPPWNFQLLSWIENAPEYLDQPGMWFLDPLSKTLHYKPYGGTTPSRAVVPLLESLLSLVGRPGSPVRNIRFSGLQFSHATWFGPNRDGYVSDQSGNFVKGPGYLPNLNGHQKIVYSTPGNVQLNYARGITFENNVFSHLGAVGIWLGTGSQDNLVINNTFTDISSAAIQVSGVDLQVNVRANADSITSGNQILDNDISYTGRDYYDTAGIFVMFAAGTTIKNNNIRHTPWSGIAIGWGWGLLDEGGFPGMPYAKYNEWGVFTTPTVARDNRLLSNRISYFLEQLWDGGAVYINGSQGTGTENGLLLQLNVVDHKRPSAGGNVFYT
ncbi:MAG: right-handed parallel beta-helix repeat-containing protein, partial [Deltaproteobacteria bacterium]